MLNWQGILVGKRSIRYSILASVEALAIPISDIGFLLLFKFVLTEPGTEFLTDDEAFKNPV
jgi:hypothetical protein